MDEYVRILTNNIPVLISFPDKFDTLDNHVIPKKNRQDIRKDRDETR